MTENYMLITEGLIRTLVPFCLACSPLVIALLVWESRNREE